MPTLIENIDSILTDKEAIRNAIIGKGIDVPTATKLSQYAGLITSIMTGHDTSSVTASAGDVLSGKKIVDANGNVISGSMTNRGAWTGKTASNGNITIPAGYHNGSGYVSGSDSYTSGYNQGVIDGRSGYYTKAQYDANYTAGYNAGYAAGRTQGQNDVKNNPGGYGLGKVTSGSFTGNQTISLGYQPTGVGVISMNGSTVYMISVYHPSVACKTLNNGGSVYTTNIGITSNGFTFTRNSGNYGSATNYYIAMK